MNGLRSALAELQAIRDAIAAGAAGSAEIVICPPATLLAAAAELCAGSTVAIGGQTCHEKLSGAHTATFPQEC